MHVIDFTTHIEAPPERCFDLARSADAHLATSADTSERVVAGRTSGLFELHDEVTWEARHFGIRQRLSVRITGMDRPRWFQDRMVRGAFVSFEHDHFFAPADGGTDMRDLLRFQSPGWLLARPIECLLLGPHLRRFLVARAASLKAMAESDQWRSYGL